MTRYPQSNGDERIHARAVTARTRVLVANLFDVSLIGFEWTSNRRALRDGGGTHARPFETMLWHRSQALLTGGGDAGLQFGVHDPKTVLGRETDAEPLVLVRPEDLDRSPLLCRELEGGEDAVAAEIVDPDTRDLDR